MSFSASAQKRPRPQGSADYGMPIPLLVSIYGGVLVRAPGQAPRHTASSQEVESGKRIVSCKASNFLASSSGMLHDVVAVIIDILFSNEARSLAFTV